MKIKTSLITVLSLILAFSSAALGHDKKKQSQRGMLESMQSVPCGAKERGLTGLGGMVASVGVQHVNSHEQLCPQYLLRTDEMDYHIRPLDTKHAAVLPVGHEAEFKLKKDRLFLRVVDGDKKVEAYQVVAMQPANDTSKNKVDNAAYHPADADKDRDEKSRDEEDRNSRPPSPAGNNPPSSEGNKLSQPASDHPPQL